VKFIVLIAMLTAVFSSSAATAQQTPAPIVFVHGDSDTSGLWMVQMWRFESNGYPNDRLFAVDIAHPSARGDDNTPETNRSSTADAARAVAAQVDAALAATGADKVVLVANSRGCQTSRNYVRNFGGQAKVAAMVLTGCVHNGVFVAPEAAQGSEYNGAGAFLSGLNTMPVIPDGMAVTTIRSDRFDLYSQPDGKFIGNPGVATGADYDSPELPGADNLVLPGADHRETAYSPAAFALIYQAITGRAPATTTIAVESKPVLSGKVSGWDNAAPSNMPLVGATLTLYATDPATGARKGAAVYAATVGEDGGWGPFEAKPDQTYEFVVQAAGYPLTRIYRSPFLRSSKVVNIRLYPAPEGDGRRIHVMRPRGYIGRDDEATANGQPLPGIPADEPVPHVWQSSVAVAPAGETTIRVKFRDEAIAAKSMPIDTPEVVWVELTY
jgi:triacylglycerol lipase